MRKLPPLWNVALLALFAQTALAACKDDSSPPAPKAEAKPASPTETPKPETKSAVGEIQAKVAAAAASVFGTGFEGAIAMSVTNPHGTENLSFLTKGGKLRVDAPAHNGETAHLVFDPKAEKTIVIIDSKKMYMEIGQHSPMMNAAGAMGGGAGAKAAPDSSTSLVKTGKHETIAGTDCEDWTVTHSNGKHAEMCVAQGVSFFDFTAMRPGAVPSNPWADKLKSEQAFPLRVVDVDATGKETSRMLVTSIEKKPVEDSLFAPPADYSPLSIPGFAGGMPGAGGGAFDPSKFMPPQGMPKPAKHSN